MANGTIYLISTPIGNLEDITLRALSVLKEVDLVYAEDVRKTKNLLNYYGINKPVVKFYEMNKSTKIGEITSLIESGKSVAFLSEAGTPGIADPGESLIKLALEKSYPLIFIPGASAVLSALIPSGLSSEQFVFLNFPPRKRSQRRELLEKVKYLPYTLIFFESKRRILSLIEDALEVLGENRKGVVARELTKKYEEFIRGTLKEIQLKLTEKAEILGEFVLIIESGKEKRVSLEGSNNLTELVSHFLKEVPLKEACKLAGKILGLKANEVYKRFINESKKSNNS